MRMSRKTLAAYDLGKDYTLISGDGASMSQSLNTAIAHHRWIVVMGWRPHSMFARYNLRFLKDPKGTLGAAQHIDVLAHTDFATDYPPNRVDPVAHAYSTRAPADRTSRRKAACLSAGDRYIHRR